MRNVIERLRVQRRRLFSFLSELLLKLRFAFAGLLEKVGGGRLGPIGSLIFLLRRPPKPRRIRTPTLLQMEAAECGAASLGIVLAYYGRWVPLEELRGACGVSRDGSKASNIVRAALRYGLTLTSFRADVDKLRRLPPPLILHWNFSHFVVLEGFKGPHAQINDPATGPRKVFAEDFGRSFTGVALGFRPGETFQPGGEPPRLITALRRRLAGSRGGAWFVVLVGLGLAFPSLVFPAFTRVFVDMVLVRGLGSWLPPLLIALGLTALLTAALTALQQWHLLKLENKIAIVESSRFFRHVLRLPMDFFHQRFAGDLANRVSINDRVAQLLSRDLARNALDLMLVVFFGGLMLAYDVPLTLMGFMVVALNVLALRWVQRQRVDAHRQLLVEQGKVQGLLTSGLQLIESIKATAAESDFFTWFGGQQAKIVNLRQRLERYTQVLDTVPPLLTSLAVAAILGFGSLRVMEGALTLGQLVTFQILMLSLAAPVERLVNLGSKLQTLEGDMSRLDDVLNYLPAGVESTAETPDVAPSGFNARRPRLAGHVELKGVTFGYSPLDEPLIQDLDLVLEPGSRVALVGASGSGKSTLARLLTGLYRPWKGEILLDGKPFHEVDPEVRGHSVAAVDQDIFLFSGTVRDNLTLWDSTLPFAEVIAAAQDADVHEDIVQRPGGYGTLVHEGGINFSGGQRQRLEIARVLAGRPSILVLDEATSALDSMTEQRIDQNLRRRGCTCLIIAHRLSTIRDADQIVVLDQGKVAQRGTHRELIVDTEGLYASLVQEVGHDPSETPVAPAVSEATDGGEAHP